MKTLHTVAGGLALVALTAFTVRLVDAQDGRGQDAAPPMDAEMMAEMMRLATPGEHHAKLTKMAGTWNNTYEMRWDPEGEWTKTSGTSESEEILGGRYIKEDIEFDVMGMEMSGVQIIGYDNLKEEYVAIWLDSMGTWPTTSRGNFRDDGVLDMKGTMIDVAGERPFRMEVRPEGDDKVFVTMFDTIPPHGEIEVMRIESTRAD